MITLLNTLIILISTLGFAENHSVTQRPQVERPAQVLCSCECFNYDSFKTADDDSIARGTLCTETFKLNKEQKSTSHHKPDPLFGCTDTKLEFPQGFESCSYHDQAGCIGNFTFYTLVKKERAYYPEAVRKLEGVTRYCKKIVR